MPEDRRTATVLLQAWRGGDRDALDRLLPVVYDELSGLAQRALHGERPDHTLQTRALVHEAYLRLVDVENMRWEDRAHFFAVSAQMMRRILVDAARARGCSKRGGGAQHLNLNESIDGMPDRGDKLVALDEALDALAKLDPRKARVVEMRFFGGLSVDETAEVLNVSAVTVMRDWGLAKAWLLRELERK
jgi:RNA polymerase sigma factor (TIGR02999 family)